MSEANSSTNDLHMLSKGNGKVKKEKKDKWVTSNSSTAAIDKLIAEAAIYASDMPKSNQVESLSSIGLSKALNSVDSLRVYASKNKGNKSKNNLNSSSALDPVSIKNRMTTSFSLDGFDSGLSEAAPSFLVSKSFDLSRTNTSTLPDPSEEVNIFDDPLYKILMECNIQDSNSPSLSTIKTVSQFDSPPPELFITARVCFLLVAQYLRVSCISLPSEERIVAEVLAKKANKTKIADLNKLALEIYCRDFSWSCFKSMLLTEKSFLSVLKSIESSSSKSTNDLKSDFSNSFTDVDLAILRSFTKQRAYHPSSCLHFSKPAADLCLWTRKIVGRIYEAFLLNQKSKSPTTHHQSSVMSQPQDSNFHGVEKLMPTSRLQSVLKRGNVVSGQNNLDSGKRELKFVVCTSSRWTSDLTQAVIGLVPTYTAVDILVAEGDRKIHNSDDLEVDDVSLQVSRLIEEVQSISSSPFHRVISLIGSSKHGEMKTNDKRVSTASFQERSSFKVDAVGRFNERALNQKDLLAYFQFRASADVLLLPLSVFEFTERIDFQNQMLNTRAQKSLSPLLLVNANSDSNANARTLHSTGVRCLGLIQDGRSGSPDQSRFIVFVTDDNDSLAAFQCAVKLKKETDSLVVVHVPYPSISDIELVASLCDVSDKEYYFRVIDLLSKRLNARVDQLKNQYKAFGYNLFVSASIDGLELAKEYERVISQSICRNHHIEKVMLLRNSYTELAGDYAFFGCAQEDIDIVVTVGIDSILNDQGSVSVGRSFYSTPLSFLETHVTSYFLVSGSNDRELQT